MPRVPSEKYMNQLARAIQIVQDFSRPYEELCTIANYARTARATCKKLEDIWSIETDTFLDKLDKLLTKVVRESKDTRYVQAVTIAFWMDQRISYVLDGPKTAFIDGLLATKTSPLIQTDSLNTNAEALGVELHPKFSTAQMDDITTGKSKPRSPASRGAHEGINGQLHNVIYVPWDKKLKIENVILSPWTRPDTQPFRVAFSPLWDAKDLLALSDPFPITWEGLTRSGRSVERVNHEEQVKARVRQAWTAACKNQVDILFFPEMLGLPDFDVELGAFCQFFQPLIPDAIREGRDPPQLTFLPSRWQDGSNTVSVLDQAGQCVGKQEKHIPYINTEEKWVEALTPKEEWRILLIHIPGAHRIAIVICAEFLNIQDDRVEKLICGQLGASLLLIPSYTKGEQDFINQLNAVKRYGTSAVWGNCCGAVTAKPIIGGVAIAGTDGLQRFSDACTCHGKCPESKSCLFIVPLPLRLQRDKPQAPEPEKLDWRLLKI